MSKDEFVSIVNSYMQFSDRIHNITNFGIETVIEGKNEIVSVVGDMFFTAIKSHYNEFGVDWIDWFVYETKFGRKQMDAYADGKLICQDVHGLYEYIEQYKLSNHAKANG